MMTKLPYIDIEAVPEGDVADLAQAYRTLLRMQEIDIAAPAPASTLIVTTEDGALRRVFDVFSGGYRTNRVLKMAGLGDSRTGAITFGAPPRINASGWAFWAEFWSRGRLDAGGDGVNFGVAGEGSDEILARVPDVLASDCDVVVLLSSVNDITGADSAGNVEATIRALIAGGKIVIVVPELPRIAGWSNARIAQHMAVRRRCQMLAESLRGCYIADPWQKMADPATGGIAAGLYYDVYVHMTKLGNCILGQAIADVAIGLTPEPSLLPAVNVGGYDPVYNPAGNITNNALMTGTAGGKGAGVTGNVADAWTMTTTADLSAAASKVTVDGVEWQQVVISGTAGDTSQYVEIAQNIPVQKMQIGDRLRVVCEIEVDAGAANVVGPILSITGSGGTTSYVSTNFAAADDATGSSPSTAHNGVMRSPEIEIKTGLATLSVGLRVMARTDGAASMTFRVRACGLFKTVVSASGDPLPVPNVITRMSPAPNAGRQSVINQLYADLGSTLYKLDALYVHAAHATQAGKLNWIASAFDLTESGAGSWVTDGYYQGNGTTGYLASGFNPVLASGLFQVTDAHMGAWMLSADPTSAQSAIGNANARAGINTSDSVGTRANDATGYGGTAAGLPAYVIWSRGDSGVYTRYKNGVKLADIGQATSGMTSAEFTIGKVATTYTVNRIAISHWGKSLTGDDVAALQAAFSGYLAAIA
jgi:hypothetical protein